jgi:CubicO group peptidase (beta-lactamase class C family)
VGPLSQSSTAATVLVLVGKEVISLDESIRTWLPELPEIWGDVTIDDLLRHTDGLPAHEVDAGSGEPADALPTAADALAVLVSEPELAFEPGTDWAMSSSGYLLLALIVARATGEEFDAVVTSQVLEPVGLVDTEVRSEHALTSTVADQLAWADELRTGAALGPDVQEAMSEPVVLPDGREVPYGRGLQLWEDPGWGRGAGLEGSWSGGSAATVLLLDRAVSASVLCSAGGITDAGGRARQLVGVWAGAGS